MAHELENQVFELDELTSREDIEQPKPETIFHYANGLDETPEAYWAYPWEDSDSKVLLFPIEDEFTYLNLILEVKIAAYDPTHTGWLKAFNNAVIAFC